MASPSHPLNLNFGAWRRLRQAWQPRRQGWIAWQSFVAGPLFSALEALQQASAGARRDAVTLAPPLFVLGHWRSGTTLLHELLSLDARFVWPTTYACFNPHHYLLTQPKALADGTRRGVARPMDGMPVRSCSPQEEEFALLSLGARSPYEALLLPDRLDAALALADPDDLAVAERERWQRIFIDFLRGVVLLGGGGIPLLKSPTHTFRVALLRRLFPEARFVVMVRHPGEVFASTVRTWQTLFERYAPPPYPSPTAIGDAVLAARLNMEQKLERGLAGLAPRQSAVIRYEDLVTDPLATLGALYRHLELDGFETMAPRVRDEWAQRAAHVAQTARPRGRQHARVAAAWGDLFEKYGYGPPGAA